jgi:hypothetical protein
MPTQSVVVAGQRYARRRVQATQPVPGRLPVRPVRQQTWPRPNFGHRQSGLNARAVGGPPARWLAALVCPAPSPACPLGRDSSASDRHLGGRRPTRPAATYGPGRPAGPPVRLGPALRIGRGPRLPQRPGPAPAQPGQAGRAGRAGARRRPPRRLRLAPQVAEPEPATVRVPVNSVRAHVCLAHERTRRYAACRCQPRGQLVRRSLP